MGRNAGWRHELDVEVEVAADGAGVVVCGAPPGGEAAEVEAVAAAQQAAQALCAAGESRAARWLLERRERRERGLQQTGRIDYSVGSDWYNSGPQCGTKLAHVRERARLNFFSLVAAVGHHYNAIRSMPPWRLACRRGGVSGEAGRDQCKDGV